MPAEIECPECNNEWPHCKVCDRVCPTCSGSGWIPANELRERGEGV